MDLDPTAAPFNVRDAFSTGVTPRRLRSTDLCMTTRGARVGALRQSLDPHAALVESLVALARDDQFFSHATAARLHGIPLPARLDDGVVHLASPSFTSRTRRAGVVGHRIKATVVDVDGLRVESVADTFVHLGTSLLTLDELVEVGDWAVHHQRPNRLSPLDLLAHAREFTGARGVQRVRAAIPLVRVGADSPGETRTRLLIARAGLPEPTLQHVVRDGSARHVATLDLAYPELFIGIEYEGAHHRLDAEQFTYDIRRIARLESLGWRIIRVTHADIVDRGRRLIPLLRDARRSIGQ